MLVGKEPRGYRKIKGELEKLLKEVPFRKERLSGYLENPGGLISPLFSFLCSEEPLMKWHAVSAMGVVVSEIAKRNSEQARTVVRRIMWHLNDESGGIGWGCPEAMGEILGLCNWLAEEYHRILISYIDPEGNLLEHEPLLEGALWGVARLCRARPYLCERAFELARDYLRSDQPRRRTYGALILCFSQKDEDIQRALAEIKKDDRIIELYWDDELYRCRVSECLALVCPKMNIS